MAFLPIVERELRIAARRKGMYRLRLLTTLAAWFVCLVVLIEVELMGGSSFQNGGPMLYRALTYYTFGLALLAGVFLASDCISAEKREGTLGLLFLTDLKGYDVVLGKLAAAGLTALCGLVSVLPVTGLPLIMGGVTGAEFWRVSLALVNALFFSLATGILISTWSRQTNRAMFATLVLLLIAVVGLPFAGGLFAMTPLPASLWHYVSFSPYYPFQLGFAVKYATLASHYWFSLGASHLFGWLMLMTASWTVPRAWQDKPVGQSNSAEIAANGSLTVKSVWSDARRARLLDKNPVLWLAGKDSNLWHLMLTLAVLGVLGIAGVLAFFGQDTMSILFVSGALWIFGMMLKVSMAFHSPKFFADGRRNGALEMILSTPLTAKQVMAGQWSALRQVFLWPTVLIVAADLMVIFCFRTNETTRVIPFLNMQVSSTTVYIGSTDINRFPIVPMIWEALRWGGDMLALGWMGMWFGLSAKKPGLAPIMNFFFILVLPMMLFCIPNLFIDLGFIFFARQKLLSEFRALALPQYHTKSS